VSGFTLIEALVVLIFTALVTMLLTESLARVFDMRTRFAAYLDAAAASEMTLSWLRHSTEALIADFVDGDSRFQGTATAFSGITLAAPGTDPGSPHAFAWRLTSNAATKELRLESRVDQGAWVAVAAWPQLTGRFDYDGGDGHWVQQWPPAMTTPTTPQLPRLIRIAIGTAADGWSAILVPNGQRVARQRNDNVQRSIIGQSQ
jgi:hypothetical protein